MNKKINNHTRKNLTWITGEFVLLKSTACRVSSKRDLNWLRRDARLFADDVRTSSSVFPVIGSRSIDCKLCGDQ